MHKTSVETSGWLRLSPSKVPVASLQAIVGAGLLGLFLVLGVGFAPMAAIHNAVHDVRHSAAFPCH
jgi:cobalt transporter subunit CbtB